MKLTVRKWRRDFYFERSRSWIEGNTFKTHWLNAYAVCVADAERFILRHCLMKAKSLPEGQHPQGLKEFLAQEGQHAVAHDSYIQYLQSQGYKLETSLKIYRWFNFSVLEPLLSPDLAFSLAVGVEHLNTGIAHIGISEDMLRGADEVARQMFDWHFYEEIEHREVAYDLMRKAHCGVVSRTCGVLLAYPLVVLDITLFALLLLNQDRKLFRISSLKAGYRFLFTQEKILFRLARWTLRFFEKDFHPGKFCIDEKTTQNMSRIKNGILNNLGHHQVSK